MYGRTPASPATGRSTLKCPIRRFSSASGDMRLRLRVDPLADRARVRQDRAVGQLQRRQLFLTGRLTQLGTRSFALPRPRAAASGDHLVVLDLRSEEGLLHAAVRMHPRAAIVAVADEERRLVGGGLSHGGVETSEDPLASESRPRARARATRPSA